MKKENQEVRIQLGDACMTNLIFEFVGSSMDWNDRKLGRIRWKGEKDLFWQEIQVPLETIVPCEVSHA